MGLRKYQSVEKVEVLSSDEHATINSELHRLGKVSASELSSDERKKLSDSLDDSPQ